MASYDSFLVTDRDRLAKELEWVHKQLKDALTQLEAFQAERKRLTHDLDAARREREVALEELAKTRNELELALAGAAGLRKALQAQGVSPPPLSQEAVELAVDLPADFIPAVEPVFEPGWIRVLEMLRKSLGASYTQLRRLAATPLQEGQRAALKLAASGLVHAQDVARVVGEYLDETGTPPQAANLGAAVSAALNTWEPTFRHRGVKLVKRLEAEQARVRYPLEALRVAFYQILRNAYEALPRGGAITVRVWQEPGTGQVCVSFADNGPGFTSAALEKLFIPFSPSRQDHLGLGLAVVRRVMQRLGGEAEASNAKEGGAMVTLRFPLEAGEKP